MKSTKAGMDLPLEEEAGLTKGLVTTWNGRSLKSEC